MYLAENKKNAIAFYKMAYEGNPQKAVELYVGDDYTQHNPAVANGTLPRHERKVGAKLVWDAVVSGRIPREADRCVAVTGHDAALHHQAGVAPERAVMVGDTSYDMEMGAAAGIATLGVTWGYHPQVQLTAAGAHRVVGDFAALETALHRIWERA